MKKSLLLKSLFVLATIGQVATTTWVEAEESMMEDSQSQLARKAEVETDTDGGQYSPEAGMEFSKDELKILQEMEKYIQEEEEYVSTEQYQKYIKTPIEDYGEKIEIKGKKINIYTIGEGEIPIVFIPGQGTITAKHQYHNLIEALKNNHKLVIVEPFGYGLSDVIDEPRTLDNVTAEIYEALQEAGITGKFVLAAHSLGGIYSLKYMADYPEQVLGFIALDTSTPGMEGGMQVDMPEITMDKLPKIEGASEEVNAQYYAIGHTVNNNPNMKDESDNGSNIINEGANYKIPKGIKALYLLAYESDLGIQLRNLEFPIEGTWEEQHIALSEDPADVSVKTLDGVHNIFDSNTEEVKKSIDEFMKQFEE